jgi:NAD(P) transhydrogenase subunit alpha
MQIAVLNETRDGESRVALVPESIKKLIALNVTVEVENGAGDRQQARASAMIAPRCLQQPMCWSLSIARRLKRSMA